MQYWTDVSIWRISDLTAAAILNKTSKTNSNILAFFPMTTLSGGFIYFPRSSILGLSKMSLFSCLSEGSSVTIWLIWSFSKLTLAFFYKHPKCGSVCFVNVCTQFEELQLKIPTFGLKGLRKIQLPCSPDFSERNFHQRQFLLSFFFVYIQLFIVSIYSW